MQPVHDKLNASQLNATGTKGTKIQILTPDLTPSLSQIIDLTGTYLPKNQSLFIVASTLFVPCLYLEIQVEDSNNWRL